MVGFVLTEDVFQEVIDLVRDHVPIKHASIIQKLQQSQRVNLQQPKEADPKKEKKEVKKVSAKK